MYAMMKLSRFCFWHGVELITRPPSGPSGPEVGRVGAVVHIDLECAGHVSGWWHRLCGALQSQ